MKATEKRCPKTCEKNSTNVLDLDFCFRPWHHFFRFFVECATGQGAFTVLPVNTVGTIGRNVTLKCALSDPVYSLSWINPSGNYVYEKGFGIIPGYEDQYLVEEEYANSYNIVVLNADLNDAGRYTCECSRLSSSASAEIILLGDKNTNLLRKGHNL